MNYSGVGSVVLVTGESVFGTGGTPDKNIGYIQSVNMDEKNNEERIFAVGSRAAAALVTKKYEASGSIEAIFQNGRLLQYAMGGAEVVTNSNSDYLHTLARGTSLVGFTMGITHAGLTNISRKYTSCYVNSFRITGDKDAPLKISADILAKTVLVGTTAYSYTADTTAVPAPQFCNLQIPATTSNVQVQNFELTHSNEVESIFAIGSRLSQAMIAKTNPLDLKASLAFVDDGSAVDANTLYSRFLDGTITGTAPATGNIATCNGALSILNGAVGTYGSGLRGMVVNFNGLVLDSCSIPVPVDGIIMQDISAMIDYYGTSNIQVYDNVTGTYGTVTA